MKGFTGKILEVNLTEKSFKEIEVDEKIYQQYLSGQGLAAWYLYNNIPANADPLGEDNILAFMSGLLTGTGSLFTGRWIVAAKSPLTGTWGDANCGGTFSPGIKRCGWDGIFFKGISREPVYFYADDDGPQLLSADGLWGLDAVEAEEKIIRESKSKRKPVVAVIGQAGENKSLISGICNDKGRIAARSGLGAVMGVKNLKAVALSGTNRIIPANREEMKRLSKECLKSIDSKLPLPPGKRVKKLGTIMRVLPTSMRMDGKMMAAMYKKWGTIAMNQVSIEMGDSPIKNWKGSCKDFNLKKATYGNFGKIFNFLIGQLLVAFYSNLSSEK